MAFKVTVGVCAYNEEQNIGPLLSNILHEQNLTDESEVIVVCSGCTDKTTMIVGQFSETDPRVKLLVEEDRRGKTSAINHILAEASGDAILFVSADTLPTVSCFIRLVSGLGESNVGVCCGNPVPTNKPDSFVGKLVQMLWSLHEKVFAEYSKVGLARHATEVFCIRRGIVSNLPPEIVNDDAYMALTARRKGWLVKFHPKAFVLIRGPETFSEYFSQRRRVLYGHHQLKKCMRESPQHLMYLLPLDPTRVFGLLLWLFSKYNPVSVVAFIYTELLVNAFASMDIFRGKSHMIWRIATSTKRILQK